MIPVTSRGKYTDIRRLERQKQYLPLIVAEEASFQKLFEQRNSGNLGQFINMTMRKIEDENHQQLAGVLSAVDYNNETKLGNREHRNAIPQDFCLGIL
jgi:type I restriction enzyme M protein